MRSFINRLGIAIHEMHYPVHNAFMYTNKIYFVKNIDVENIYRDASNIAFMEDIPHIEDAFNYRAALELQALYGQLPIDANDRIFGMDITEYDIIIPDMDHTVIYDGLSKRDVILPKDFFEEDTNRVLLFFKRFRGPLFNLPEVGLN